MILFKYKSILNYKYLPDKLIIRSFIYPILYILMVSVFLGISFIFQKNNVSLKLTDVEIFDMIFSHGRSWISIYIIISLITPAIENILLIVSFKFLYRIIKKIYLSIFLLSFLWGIVHTLGRNFNFFIPSFLSFILMHDLYALSISQKKDFPWIYPLIHHIIINSFVVLSLYTIVNFYILI